LKCPHRAFWLDDRFGMARGRCSSAKKIDVGGTCILNSDCMGSLVCTMGKCHDACHKSADCPTGQSCVKTSDSVICQLPAEFPAEELHHAAAASRARLTSTVGPVVCPWRTAPASKFA